MHYRSILTAVVGVLIAACGESAPDANDNGTPQQPPVQQSCSCSCNASVLMQSCGDNRISLGDYGSPAKCQAQLAGGHPGCR